MDRFKRNRIIATVSLLLVLATVATIVFMVFFFTEESLTPVEKAKMILSQAPLIDGHNDFASNLRRLVYNDLRTFNFTKNLSQYDPWRSYNYSQTDIPRLKAGGVGAQFWVARAECESQYKDAVQLTLEQIDVIKRLVSNYSDHLELVTDAEEIEKVMEKGEKIASLIGVEGGHSIQSSLSVLRMYYELGVRYLTLNQFCSTPCGVLKCRVDSSSVDPSNMRSYHAMNQGNQGLTSFGEDVIREMNRLGMIIDLSHASVPTVKDVMLISKAPVIFSHTLAKGLCNVDPNIADNVLKDVVSNERQRDAVIMVNFFSGYLRCDGTEASIQDVVNHIDYLRNKTTIDNLGIGSDFDGTDKPAKGLEDVSKYPDLFAALIETGRWSDEDLEKLASKNFLRVLYEVEKVRDELKDMHPVQNWVKRSEVKKQWDRWNCTTPAAFPPEPVSSILTYFGKMNG